MDGPWQVNSPDTSTSAIFGLLISSSPITSSFGIAKCIICWWISSPSFCKVPFSVILETCSWAKAHLSTLQQAPSPTLERVASQEKVGEWELLWGITWANVAQSPPSILPPTQAEKQQQQLKTQQQAHSNEHRATIKV